MDACAEEAVEDAEGVEGGEGVHGGPAVEEDACEQGYGDERVDGAEEAVGG